MAGGRGGGVFSGRSPEEVAELIRKSESMTADTEFTSKLGQTLGDLLAAFNSRDTELVQRRLDEIRTLLEDAIEDRVDLQFGGSVAKRTYVDGLSDIDSLLIINDTKLELKTPEAALDRITSILKRKLGKEAEVSHGQMAVTVQYPDGMKIQLLPAIKTEEAMKIPSSNRDAWSEVEPQGFRQALTKRNEECGRKLVPTIKLAKAILGSLPESQRLTGYHVESLAIAAFRGYGEEKTTTAMLPTFFERAKGLVLQPIRDRTGQSVHVDDYLGEPNSEARANASHILARIAKRMRNANAAGSIAQWKDLFGMEE
jgi:hypothetical protein